MHTPVVRFIVKKITYIIISLNAKIAIVKTHKTTIKMNNKMYDKEQNYYSMPFLLNKALLNWK